MLIAWPHYIRKCSVGNGWHGFISTSGIMYEDLICVVYFVQPENFMHRIRFNFINVCEAPSSIFLKIISISLAHAKSALPVWSGVHRWFI